MITSTQNPRVVAVTKLQRSRERRKTKRTLLEGPFVIAAALERGVQPLEVYAVEASIAGLDPDEVTLVSPEVMNRMAPTEHPRGPLAVIEIPEPSLPDGHILVLWGVADPGNAGTLVRTAVAFGAGVVAGPGTVDLWSPKVIRSGAGAHFATAVGLIDDLDALAGHEILATVVEGGVPPAAITPADKVAIIVGSEAHGLPPDVVAGADALVTIAMSRGIESLNAAMAGAIVAYELLGRG